MTSPLMQVRAVLATTSNTSTGVGTISTVGVEIQKKIEEMTIEAFNKNVDFSNLLKRVSISQLSYIWNLTAETAAGSGLGAGFEFYSDGGVNSPDATTKIQLSAIAKSYRTDYAVTGLFQAAAMGPQGLAYEAAIAASDLAVGEERSIIAGSYTGGWGFASAFDGLIQLMSSNATFGSTTAKYGLALGTSTSQNVSVVFAGATSADALTLADLDAAVTLSDNRGGKGHRRIWLCSNDRRDEIDQLLQAQQRFVAPSMEIEGGMRVSSYKGIPIIGSRFMDKNGVLYDASDADWSNHFSGTDQSMYLLDLDHIFMAHVAGVHATHVPITGGDGGTAANFSGRYDEIGGYFKSYGVPVMDRFDTQVLICNLTDI